MNAELEAAAVDSHREVFRHRPRHVRPVGSPCPNCGAALQGPWCHACGQSAEELHRSIVRLAGEAVESFTHFDGRFWRTIPSLLLKPGRLTRDYIDDHRAAQIPPLRLFLIALLLLFFTSSLGGAGPIAVIESKDGQGRRVAPTRVVKSLNDLTPAERAKLDKGLADARVQIAGSTNTPASAWLTSRVKAAVANPERFKLILETWAERFAFLMLPIAALTLTALFAFQRRFYVFDHTIFALHSLAFLGLLITLMFLLRRVVGGAAELLVLAAPVHLFLHMRGVYGTSVLGTLVRMALLFVGSSIGFGLLVVGLLWVGLSAMNG